MLILLVVGIVLAGVALGSMVMAVQEFVQWLFHT